MLKAVRLLAWLLFAGIAFATLCPIGERPDSAAPLSVQHLGAYALLCTLFTLAYPRRHYQVLFLLIVAAGLLEAAQLFEPTRHARVSDFLVKASGCGFGSLISLVWACVEHVLRSRMKEQPVLRR